METKTAVVQAYLFAGQPVDSIRITQSVSYSQEDTLEIPINDLELNLDDGDNNLLLESIGEGYYALPGYLPAEGRSFTLEFEYDGKIVKAETLVPLKKEAMISVESIEMEKIELGTFPGGLNQNTEDIEVTWDNSEGDYYYVLYENIEDDPEYINAMLEQFLAENGQLGRFSAISEPQIMDFYTIRSRQIQQFGTYRVIIFRVNPEYVLLYESNGNSSVSLQEPLDNIENGLGIFTGVNSDTLYFEVLKK